MLHGLKRALILICSKYINKIYQRIVQTAALSVTQFFKKIFDNNEAIELDVLGIYFTLNI